MSFRKALANKEYEKAWKIAANFWTGNPKKQRVVLFEMLKQLLKDNNGEGE